ncbi:MAG TPA: roadblock/LC7 domain-containing protein [Verrucomicrobiae bacterium]|jgi:predicted regulator of Ras-like GTPase activity (Roadblock/LC7/MglB family)
MATLPQLIEADVRLFDEALTEFIGQTGAIGALVIDKGGFLLTHVGNLGDLDLTTLGALASGAFMASQTMAGLVNEKNFNSTYQQGEKFSLYILEVDEQCLLAIIFGAEAGLGLVKYYSSNAASRIAQQLAIAQKRDPANGFDLSALNVADSQALFRRKTI